MLLTGPPPHATRSAARGRACLGECAVSAVSAARKMPGQGALCAPRGGAFLEPEALAPDADKPERARPGPCRREEDCTGPRRLSGGWEVTGAPPGGLGPGRPPRALGRCSDPGQAVGASLHSKATWWPLGKTKPKHNLLLNSVYY
ncbi:hypothetical protein HJG60_009637 [Phyllostomus discolor]|uniref:Uncharacterized protein n=1 Tax=Phyllostomus discolor TaxID=89673 RepID=A0A834BBT0_9CHIR|nr:hypothetical protein HJG60_009637 [Phyllostomus discolor]